ncbi:MAG: hypothetical protein RXP27_05220 [Nitrososphaeria archaeon]
MKRAAASAARIDADSALSQGSRLRSPMDSCRRAAAPEVGLISETHWSHAGSAVMG